MVCEDVLKVKNLPHQLSDQEKEEFLQHFGGKNVKIVSSQCKGKSVAYVKFGTKEEAKSVLFRLHQFNVLNKRLCVEYAEYDIGHDKPLIKSAEHQEKDNKKFYKTFINKINAWNSAVSFNQPPPAHLKYVYPKANRATINNIAHALASVPKFYTQVLHLMNKMNLPPPFSNVPDPPFHQSARMAVEQTRAPPNITERNSNEKAVEEESDESELESDAEDGYKQKDVIPVKRKLPQKKAIKRPKFIKPPPALQNAGSARLDGEDMDKVFDKSTLQVHKKIELKVTSESLDRMVVEEEHEDQNAEQHDEHIEIPKGKFISEQELENNRIPLRDLGVLAVFKDYHPGIPSSRLYIKNVSKSVEKSDLDFIFKRFVKVDAEKSAFEVKLMQEGRMKGQAFITFDSIEAAQKACKETNGFILKDKPLVVVFAKSVTIKKQ